MELRIIIIQKRYLYRIDAIIEPEEHRKAHLPARVLDPFRTSRDTVKRYQD